MPTYQYECGACGHAFELVQSISEPKQRRCPRCHKDTLYRLIGAGGGIIFKGAGFYETDYKRRPEPATKPAASCPAAKGTACPSCPTDASKTGQ